MKTLNLIILLILSATVLGQEPTSAIENTDQNFLYRGYKNRLKVAVTDNNGCKILLTGTNCEIEKGSDTEYHTVVPGSGRTTILTVSLIDGNDTVEISKSEYRVMKMPDPTLYWGSAKSGSVGSRSSRLIMMKYPPEIPLHAYFNVLRWEMFVGDSLVASGEGSNLKNAHEFLIAPNPQDINIQIIVTGIGPDEITRELNGTWFIRAHEGGEIKETPVRGCG